MRLKRLRFRWKEGAESGNIIDDQEILMNIRDGTVDGVPRWK